MCAVSVHDSYYPVRTSVDIPYTDDYNPDSYEYSTPYLCPEELGDFYMVSEEIWESEEQAVHEDWDNAEDWKDCIFGPKVVPGDWAWDNAEWLGESALELIAFVNCALDAVEQRRNYNPPKKRMGSKTVPVHKKEVPDKVIPQQPKTPMSVPVTKMGVSKRIPIKELPLFLYRGWKEIKQ
jgi:hypothetical protein